MAVEKPGEAPLPPTLHSKKPHSSLVRIPHWTNNWTSEPLWRRLSNFFWLFFICHILHESILVMLVVAYLLFFTRCTWYLAPLIVLYFATWMRGSQRSEHGAWSWYRRGWKNIYYGTFLHYDSDEPSCSAQGIKDGEQYIFGYHPHGIYPVGTDALVLDACDFNKRFPKIKLRVLAASVIFRLPLLREHAMWRGYVDASRSVVERLLRKGYSIAIVLGGEREVLEADSDPTTDIKLVLRKRHGFVQQALKNGVSLVPCFAFGQDQMYAQMKSFKSLRLWFIRKFAVTLTLFWGSLFLLPYEHRCDIVVGNPIPVPKIQEPTTEDIEKYHKIYVDALVDMYNRHKDKYGYTNRKLEIM